MAQRKVKKERGVFERTPGSGVWWIVYYANGKRHREKVGRRGDAIDLYRVRKADLLRGRKLPDLRPGAAATLSDLMADAVAYAQAHLNTHTDYTAKQRILADPFGARPQLRLPLRSSAMRWSEQFSITWSQVDFKRLKIVGVYTKTTRKAKVRKCDVPLNSVSVAALKELWIIDGKKEQAQRHRVPEGWAVLGLGLVAEASACQAKIEDVVWHSLRHTCLSWAAMSGATMKQIQELGGHLTISQAASYMHLSPAHTSQASERMAQWKPTAAG
jgi:integrase